MPRFAVEQTHVTLRRGLAQLVDYIVLAPVWFGIDALFHAAVLNWVMTGAALMIYFGWMQGMTGWTIGKLLVGIRVVDAHGRPPGPDAGVKRAVPLLLEWFGALALVMILRSPWRQRAGDRWAGTYVVRR